MVSIIIPIYNAAGHLPNMIRCIVAQTEQNFEVILIDDGSIDNSGDICDGIVSQDARFRCIHQPNSGVSAARNRGMEEATGDFVMFLDADDMIPPNYLQELLRTCENADIAVCDVVVKEAGDETNRFSYPSCVLTQAEALNALLTRQTINSGPCAKIFRRELLASLAFPPLKAYEDILFVKDAFSKARRIAVTNKTAYDYIQNVQGAMNGFIKAPSLDIIKATDELLGFIVRRKDLSPKTLYITASHLMQYVQLLLGKPSRESNAFILSARQLYQKHKMQILCCTAFPWKEKIVYLAFADGWQFKHKKLTRIGD